MRGSGVETRARMSTFVIPAAVLFLNSCTGGTSVPSPNLSSNSVVSPSQTETTPPPLGVQMAALPAKVVAKCERVAVLRPACPQVAPKAEPPLRP